MTQLQEKYNERLRETLFEAQLTNGLQVYLLPKMDFRQTYATFTTKYGSLDSEFRDPLTGEHIKVPDGIAHFLEHKMFEEEEGDVFSKFSRLGAQANAFTTFDSTTYLFSSTRFVDENIEVLLDFVQKPYFTDENVEKEKGIIAQEIKMYEDNPNWRAYFGLLKGFYGGHPAATDIAGTVDSIAKITKEDLYRCYHTFYHPSNMIFFVVGPIDPEHVLSLLKKNQANKSFSTAMVQERFYPPLPEQAIQKATESRLSIAQPRVLFGYKDKVIPENPQTRNMHEAAMEIWLDACLGRGSKLYHELIDEGLTDQGFSSDYELSEHYGHTVFGGNSNNPLQLVERVKQSLIEMAANGLAEADFNRAKRKAIGRFVALFDSPQGIAHTFTTQKLRGIDVFDSISLLEQLDLQMVNKVMKGHLDDSQFAMSLVRQMAGEDYEISEPTN